MSEALQRFDSLAPQDADFFAFFRSMQAYETSLKTGAKVVLAPDSPFFRYFEQANGQPAPAPAPQAGAPAAPR